MVTCIMLVLAVGIAVDDSAHGEGPRDERAYVAYMPRN